MKIRLLVAKPEPEITARLIIGGLILAFYFVAVTW